MNKAQEAFYLALQDGNTNSADDALKNLDSAPHLDQESDQLREELKQLLLEAKKLHTAPSSAAGGSRNAQLQQQNLIGAFVSWSRQYNQWLKTSGKRYSGLIEVTEPSP